MSTSAIWSKCVPALRTDIQRCGSLTVCNAVIPTPSELDGIFMDTGEYRLMNAAFAYRMELKAAGAEFSPFQKFIEANTKPRKVNLIDDSVPGLPQIRPYFSALRYDIITNEDWKATEGAACDSDGTPNPAGDHWKMTFESPTGIPGDTRWFNPKERVFLEGIDSAGNSIKSQYKVVSRTLSGNTVICVLLGQNAGSFLPAARRADVVQGSAYPGTANVQDWETFCQQPPGLINSRLDDFWWETTRDTLCDDDLVNQWIEMVKAENPLYEKFYHLPAAQYNKQAGEFFTKKLIRQYMYSKPLENQRRATVDRLEQITTVEPGGGRCVGRRAAAVGWYEQLAECDRVADLMGTKFSILSLANSLYRLMKYRESIGHPSPDVFDIFVPSTFIPVFQSAMVKYWKLRGIDSIKWEWQNNGNKEGTPFAFRWKTFFLEWPNVQINLITDRWFDDNLDMKKQLAATLGVPAFGNVGRQMWIIDWRTVYTAMLGSNRVVNEVGDLSVLAKTDPATYACVMKMPKKRYTMTSTTYAPMVEHTKANLIIENFDASEPDYTSEDAGDYDGDGVMPS